MPTPNLKARVEAKCDHLVNCSFWPSEILRFRRWLNNFDAYDALAAAKILDHFVFLNRDYVRHAIVSTYRRYLRGSLDAHVDVPRDDPRIHAHHDRVVATPVLGESPSPADSGFGYARLARDHLHISRVVELPAAISAAVDGDPVILLDDFCGTGQQVLTTLRREIEGQSLLPRGASNRDISCITVVATSYATSFLGRAAPELRLLATHHLQSDEYSVQSLLPEADNPEVYELISKFAPHLDVPDHVAPDFGFHNLGLLVGIQDSIPDASIPLLWATGPDDWTPLMERKP